MHSTSQCRNYHTKKLYKTFSMQNIFFQINWFYFTFICLYLQVIASKSFATICIDIFFFYLFSILNQTRKPKRNQKTHELCCFYDHWVLLLLAKWWCCCSPLLMASWWCFRSSSLLVLLRQRKCFVPFAFVLSLLFV